MRTILLPLFLFSLAVSASAADVIVHEHPDGRLRITTPTKSGGFTAKQVAKKDVPFGCRFKIVKESAIPSDEFRDAWIFDPKKANGVGVDMPKARGILRERLRSYMRPIMEDASFLPPDQESEIKTMLHGILNAPEIEAAKSEDDLRKILKSSLEKIKG